MPQTLTNAQNSRSAKGELNRLQMQARNQEQEAAEAAQEEDQEHEEENDAAKQEKDQSKKSGTLDKTATKLTGGFLRQSWLYILPTFGLSFLYTLGHFLGRYFIGSQKFSRFGTLFDPNSAITGKEPSKSAEMGEILLFIFVLMALIFVIFGFFSIISIVAYYAFNPGEAAILAAKVFVEYLKNKITAFLGIK